METAKLKKFAQFARRSLRDQVTARLKSVLADDSLSRRESPQAVTELEKQIKERGEDQVVETVAYTWFNRFCALRFMDVNHYTRISVVSPVPGQFQPEILAEAKMGHIDKDMGSEELRRKILEMLRSERSDAQGEAYRLLLVATCNAWYKSMPFLFEKIADYTELLMPDDLLSGNSILAYTRETMTPDACKDVEVIGWLYQFYISEKKDEVFDGLKKNKKITPENIPAATQLFTPHWIVRYLVENSLGRLWMLNHPNSRLKEQMEYFITTEDTENTETDFLRVNSPEELKICDPACGSGHMLTYAFDLLYAIYEEEGYAPSGIPEKILTHNLYGIEIDERAGELAAFALTMKARSKQRRFFSKGVKPNICVLEKLVFDENELVVSDQWLVASGALRENLVHDLHLFEEADNFGSLLTPRITAEQSTKLRQYLTDHWSLAIDHSLFEHGTHKKVLQVLDMADYLSSKYHVVIANPPYMGGKGMNPRIKSFLQSNYKNAKADLFGAFMFRNVDLATTGGFLGFVTPYVWMFISTYEKLREFLLANSTVNSLVQLEYNAFEPACVPVCTFVLQKGRSSTTSGCFIKLSKFKGYDTQAPRTLEAIRNPSVSWRHIANTSDFIKIPGYAFAYWLSNKAIDAFTCGTLLGEISAPKQGLATTDNNKFLRCWFELPLNRIAFGIKDRSEALESNYRWFPYNKGGDYRRWYGNNEFVVNWANDGEEIKENVCRKYSYLNGNPDFVTKNQETYFKEGITWTYISNAYFGVRYSPVGFIFDVAGSSVFPDKKDILPILSFMSSVVANYYIGAINPTMNIQAGNVGKLPVMKEILSQNSQQLSENASRLIAISKDDWNSLERSWNFKKHPLLHYDINGNKLSDIYESYRFDSQNLIERVISCELINNNFFVEKYGLQDELLTELPLSAVTLTCNPHYRYKLSGQWLVASDQEKEDELERRLCEDTMKEFLSYAVGCMFGRYSLDKPGLILANAGETLADYLAKVSKPLEALHFEPDDDNVIPILEGDWFTDDAAERFRKFLRVTFGDDHYEENLRFIEEAIGKSIEKYFLKDFYADHVKRYKKRPIYWLFSSPKGSFNALIYMHRYRPDTVSVVLNDYLREFRTKLSAKLEHLLQIGVSADASKSDKTKALKVIEKIKKILAELDTYEHDILYPLAGQQIEIDLDDGVKVNYPKFGKALKKVTGLNTK